MPQTIIKVKTYMCPNGIGKNDPEKGIPKGTCRAQGAESESCSLCKLQFVRATLPLDLGTMTIMGEEEIQAEIDEEVDEPGSRGIDVSTEAKKNVYRAERKKDIAKAIIEARKHEDK